MCSLCLFLRRLEGGFAEASELLEPESFLCAIGSLASELSEVECCPLCYLPDAGPVVVCSLDAGSHSELLLP